jgi:hypothetical protein
MSDLVKAASILAAAIVLGGLLAGGLYTAVPSTQNAGWLVLNRLTGASRVCFRVCDETTGRAVPQSDLPKDLQPHQ